MSSRSSRPSGGRTPMPRSTEGAGADAAQVSEHLEAILRVVRESIWAQAQQLPVPLTAPQMHALELLVDELRQSGRGLSLSELSRRMGLAHSTVSGIVDRLAQRVPGAEDRRFVSIELTGPVRTGSSAICPHRAWARSPPPSPEPTNGSGRRSSMASRPYAPLLEKKTG